MKKSLKMILFFTSIFLSYNCSGESDSIEKKSEVVVTPVAGVLSFSEITKNSVKLSWRKFSNNELIKKIILKRDNTEIFSSTAVNVISQDYSFLENGLSPDTNYNYQLVGYDASDKMYVSNAIAIKTLKNVSVLGVLNLPAGIKDETAINWNQTTGTVEILKSVNFSVGATTAEIDADKDGFNWIVPDFVNKIIIKTGVTVTGHFKLGKTLTIEGEDRATSIIYGTAKRKWALGPNGTNDSPNCNAATGDDLAADCQKWQYGGISGNQVGAVYTIKKLTIKNARTYAVTSFESKIIMDNVYVVNTRPADDGQGGDYSSNSDGVSAGKDSEIRNCKFDTWDDSIKLYKDMTVENVTIVQNGNGAAFQLGWGSKPTTVNTLKNILIVTKNEQYSNLSVFSVSGETADIPSTINLGDFAVRIESGQKFRNTTKSLPLFLIKSAGNVSIQINQIGTNYSLVSPAGFGKYNSQGTPLGGTLNITGTICNKAFTESAIDISCGNSTLVTGCGW
ncbi:MAG: fibronectin type III domain-containing protein [Bacteroidia bacterium]|nr:fibronectin type III domain-containing protein [Bacteroidia bacterium]